MNPGGSQFMQISRADWETPFRLIGPSPGRGAVAGAVVADSGQSQHKAYGLCGTGQ